MVWRPDASDGVVDGLDWLGLGSQLLSVGVSEEDSLLHDAVWLEVANTDSLLTAVDVGALDDWVLVWARRDGDLDLRVGLGELWELVADEEAGNALDTAVLGINKRYAYFMPLELPAQSQ